MKVSVIIPVLNESERIGGVLIALEAAAEDVPYEVIVVDGDPAGGTLSAIPSGRALTMTAPKGRAYQMNAGAARSSGDLLLFLHADTRLPPAALPRIIAAMQDGRFAGGAFDLGIDNPRWIFRATAWCASRKHRLTRVPYGDQAIFLRREVFDRLGGYPEIPLMEDVEFMKRLKKQGWHIIILPDAVVTSARKWEKEGVLFTMLRNWTLQALYLFGVPAEKLVRLYYREDP